MAESAKEPSLRVCKQGLSDAKYLLKRGRSKLTEPALQQVEQSIAALEDAISSNDEQAITAASKELTAAVDAHLSRFRKTKMREYTESIGLAILIALILRSFILEPFQIPSGSMRPTLLEGDRLFVLKFSHGIRIPMTNRYLIRWGEPTPGDVVVFVYPGREILTQFRIRMLDHAIEMYEQEHGAPPDSLESLDLPVQQSVGNPLQDAWGTAFSYEIDSQGPFILSAGEDRRFGTDDDYNSRNYFDRVGQRGCLSLEDLGVAKDYVKRIVAGPGDKVEMRDNNLYVNDRLIERVGLTEAAVMSRFGMTMREVATESIDGTRSWETHVVGLQPDFEPWTVRPGHFFVIGDNRDDSADSRCWGEVPTENIKGSAKFIFYSHDSLGSEGVRWSRSFQRIR